MKIIIILFNSENVNFQFIVILYWKTSQKYNFRLCSRNLIFGIGIIGVIIKSGIHNTIIDNSKYLLKSNILMSRDPMICTSHNTSYNIRFRYFF